MALADRRRGDVVLRCLLRSGRLAGRDLRADRRLLRQLRLDPGLDLDSRARDPEIDQYGSPARQHDVVGLDVSMRDPVPVRVVQRLEHVTSDGDRLRDAQASLAPQHLAEAFALDVGHDEPQQVIRFAAVQEAREVRVVEPGGVAHLAQEAVGRYGDRELGVKHLDGDPPPRLVGGAENGRVTATPDGGDRGIAIAQRLAHSLDQLASRHSLCSHG